MQPMMMPTDSWLSVVKWMQSMVLTAAHMGCIFASPGALLTNIQTLVCYSMQPSSVVCNELYPFSPQGYLPQQGWRVYRGIWNHLFVNPGQFLGPSHTGMPSHTVDVSGKKCHRASINNLIHNHELFIYWIHCHCVCYCHHLPLLYQYYLAQFSRRIKEQPCLTWLSPKKLATVSSSSAISCSGVVG